MIDNLHTQTRHPRTFRNTESPDSESSMHALRRPDSNGILGESTVMRELQMQLQHLAATSSNVLIYGEPGTGKRLLSRAIHVLEGDPEASVGVVMCSDGVAAVLNSIASLTQSSKDATRPATVILDDIGQLSPAAQAELVQGLDGQPSNGHHSDGQENGHYLLRPRILAIFEGDAQRALTEGLLNREAIQRLAPLQLGVPALRNREDDAALLADYFLALLNSEEGTAKVFSGESLLFLRRYAWPGNVRELRSAVQRAFVLADRELQLAAAARKSVAASTSEEPSLRIIVGTSLADAEKRMIVATLRKCGGNKTRAAALLGVSLKTLYNRLNGYRAQGLELSQVDPEFTEVAV